MALKAVQSLQVLECLQDLMTDPRVAAVFAVLHAVSPFLLIVPTMLLAVMHHMDSSTPHALFYINLFYFRPSTTPSCPFHVDSCFGRQHNPASVRVCARLRACVHICP